MSESSTRTSFNGYFCIFAGSERNSSAVNKLFSLVIASHLLASGISLHKRDHVTVGKDDKSFESMYLLMFFYFHTSKLFSLPRITKH